MIHTIKYYDSIPFENGGGDIHLAWKDEYNTIFDSLPKHTPEVKGYSREQMREYLIEFMNCHSMKSKTHLERLVDDFISSLPTPSTDKGVGD